MRASVLDSQWKHLNELVSFHLGLHFPLERWDDLKRGIEQTAQELGCVGDAVHYVSEMLAMSPSQKQLGILASHLTVGETYFFRDPATWQALEEKVLAELIRTRRGVDQRLRIWSAACCSGEEPYSVAILLHRLLPDLKHWDVTITATDINPRFLAKASEAIYSEWSFRSAPAWLKRHYFKKTADGRYRLIDEIKNLVRFQQLNLVEDDYPSQMSNKHAMDLVFCRNVLMYFSSFHITEVANRLEGALSPGGWLIVSPSEASAKLFSRLRTRHISGAILFEKPGVMEGHDTDPSGPLKTTFSRTLQSLPKVCRTGKLREAVKPQWSMPRATDNEHKRLRLSEEPLIEISINANGPEQCMMQARTLASTGELAEALVWCDRWIAAEKLNSVAYYLRAVILQEQGKEIEARKALQSVIFLDQSFIMAHFSLGHLARIQERHEESARHFGNALHFLQLCPREDTVPESGGLTAGRLTEILKSFHQEPTEL